MAYAPATSQPVCLVQGIAGSATNTAAASIGRGGSVWYYSSADADGTVVGADYFSDGDELGMRVGDVLFSFDTAGVMTLFYVSAVTAGGAATVAVATVTT